MTTTSEAPTGRRRVRVWFGEHVVADYNAEPEMANRYAAAMSRRFASLRVTNDPMPAVDRLQDPQSGGLLWGNDPK